MTEVWFRNPHNYVRELAEVGAVQVAWDRGMLVKKRIDPYNHAKLYFSNSPDWRVLMVGTQGTAELRRDHGIDQPYAVYPTWSAAEEGLELLEEMMEYPLGEDAEACNDPNVAPDERPVSGQEHRVVVVDIPNANSGPGRSLIRKLKELQEDYPNCILHVHGLYGWRVSFGMGFGATDVDPRTNAGKGKVQLPSGKEVFAERTIGLQQWVTLLGMTTADLMREPRNRCIYNIKSAMWAGEHYMENIAFKTGGSPVQVDPDSKSHVPATSSFGHLSKPGLPVQPNDKIQCDTCSLQNSCKYYRQGSVCSVPGSEPASLANQFKTRDADLIIDGLGTLLGFQARRLEKGAKEEEEYGELDPEVTKIANSLFSNGVKLAKLVNPNLNGPGVTVNVGGGNAAAIQASTPNQVLGSIVRELESRGIRRQDITPEMVGNLLAEMNGTSRAPEAIEGHVVSKGV